MATYRHTNSRCDIYFTSKSVMKTNKHRKINSNVARRLARLPDNLQRVFDQEVDSGAVRPDPGADRVAGASHPGVPRAQVHAFRDRR